MYRLKHVRIKRGITQEEASIRSGIPISTLRKYEQGVTDISGSALVKLAKLYKVTSDELLGCHYNGKYTVEREELDVLEHYRNLPNNDRLILRALSERLDK